MDNSSLNRSRKETFFLTLLLITGRITTNHILLHTKSSGTGAPISALISGIFAALIITFLSFKFTGRKKRNIPALTESIFGKCGKFILSAFLLIAIFLSSVYLLTETVQFMKLTAFPTTPVWFIAMFFVLGAFMGAVNGSGTIFKVSVIIVSSFVLSLIILAISVLCRSNPTNLFPLLGNSVPNLFKGGFSGISLYGDIVLLFMLKPEHTAKKSSRITIIFASILGILVNVLITIAYTAKIPYPISASEQFPLYLLLKEVQFGRFFQRMDSLFLLSSALNIMLSLALNLYILSDIFRQTFKIQTRKVTLLPLSLLLFFVAIFPQASYATTVFVLSAILLGIFILIALFTRKEVSTPNER